MKATLILGGARREMDVPDPAPQYILHSQPLAPTAEWTPGETPETVRFAVQLLGSTGARVQPPPPRQGYTPVAGVTIPPRETPPRCTLCGTSAEFLFSRDPHAIRHLPSLPSFRCADHLDSASTFAEK